jgi:hypothetical protein
MNLNERVSGDGASGRTEGIVGLVDGSVPASTRRFHVVLSDDSVLQLDELVASSHQLPDGKQVTHYGIVVEGTGQIEGAQLPSDTQRITADHTMPGITSRRVEIQILRTVPELWLPPEPGAEVVRAAGPHRDNALFLDQMDMPLAIGLDQADDPIYADFAFVNGEKGGHISISGISGVATKTSYALFLLYMLLETPQGRAMLGPSGPATRALVFNVKGEDLMHLDRPNAKFAGKDRASAQWAALGVDEPHPFSRCRFYAPRSAGSHAGAIVTDVISRDSTDVQAFGWTPAEFIRQGLLRFCFAENEDTRTQVSFVEQRVRVQLVRHAYPLDGEPGAVLLADPPQNCSYNFGRVIEQKREPRNAFEGAPIREFADLVDFLTEKLTPDDQHHDPAWHGGVQAGTALAFLRRLYALTPRLGHLITTGVSLVALEQPVTVVDLHGLHDAAQRFIVGALVSRIFDEKQGHGREPLRFIVLDELNKYAPRDGTSPIKDMLVDIAARGRSLGVLLVGAQQSAGDVDPTIIRNASLKVVGRLDAGETAEYRFLSSEVRERAARFLPGTMVLDQPLIPAALPLRFPFPAFATCVAEDVVVGHIQEATEAETFEKL